MKCEIILPEELHLKLKRHLFQNDLEQAAFLFATFSADGGTLKMTAVEVHLVLPEAWDCQSEMHLQMSDEERGKILKMARDKGLALVDCHSHPHAGDDVWFSGSDVAGITEFAAYVNWKLGNKPFAAIVWGEDSIDAVAWNGAFDCAQPVEAVRIENGSKPRMLVPKNTWFTRRYWKNRYEQE
jgi:proteasome lid subunit RPN8/RPN11